MAIGIRLEAAGVLSHAMAHNGGPVVSRLTVDGVAADTPGARLRLAVADAAGPVGQPREILLDPTASPPPSPWACAPAAAPATRSTPVRPERTPPTALRWVPASR